MADPYNYSDGAAQSGRDQIVQALMGVQNPPPGGADPTAMAAPPAPRTLPPDAGPTSAVPTPAQAPMGAVPPGNLAMTRPTPPMPIQGNPALQAQAMQSQLQPPPMGQPMPPAPTMTPQMPPMNVGQQPQGGMLGQFPQSLGIPPRY
jgi:hypothetical protein